VKAIIWPQFIGEKMTYEIISIRKRKCIKIVTSIDIYKAIKKYASNEQELFIVITLNVSHEIIAIHIASVGSSNMTIIQPREIFKHAVRDNAVAIIVAHNHPSGAVEPSPEDVGITERIIEAGKILGIHVIDHLIISKRNYYSFGLGKIPD
jgi:DNA repair protein RadC